MAVEVNRTGSAEPQATSEFGSLESGVIADDPEHRCVRFGFHLNLFSVDIESIFRHGSALSAEKEWCAYLDMLLFSGLPPADLIFEFVGENFYIPCLAFRLGFRDFTHQLQMRSSDSIAEAGVFIFYD